MKCDITDFMNAMEKARFSSQEIVDIAGAGSAVVKTTQKILCPVDTGATRASVIEYWKKGATFAEIKIGPSTTYAPYIEYGTSNPNYPVQPFIVPSATGKSRSNCLRAILYAIRLTLKGKGLL